jgi:riboflavin transporter FmnP
MWIDIVAVTWLMAFFLFGIRMSLLVSLGGALVITLFAPDTWLGASMKWVASFPMWFILGMLLVMLKKPLSHYARPINLVLPVVLALGLRLLFVIPLNYYYAIPIWTGMTTAQAILAIPWYIIAVFNVIQGLVDVILAWILVNKFRLNRFSHWKKDI